MDDLSPSINHGNDKRRSLRRQSIEEILTSEKSYLKQLEILIKYFINPLKEKNLIELSVHTSLFGQIEMIYNLNGEFLKELETNLDNIALSFVKMAPYFKLYSVYAFDYKNAILIVQDLINKNSEFRKFVYNAESRPEVQTKLNSLLIVPIQRVPRYRLLLQQVLLYTSPSENEYKILIDSIKQVESTVAHINSVIEDQESTQILINLQNSLMNRSPNIVKPSRKIIKEGILMKMSGSGSTLKRYCILMSDIFMYCKILKERPKNTLIEGSLECCCIFPLKKCKVSEIFPGNFKISCQGDGVILCSNDVFNGQSWVQALKGAIDLHIECRKTLRKESSKRKPIRSKKDVKHFELDAILSPNRRKTEYENVFRCGNDSDSEDGKPSTSCFNLKPILKRKRLETPNQVIALANPKIVINEDGFSQDSNFDPTYGFASRASSSKTYIRAKTVDSSIPVSPNVSLPISEDVEYQDLLYPLRESTGSCKSGSSSFNDENEKENSDHRRKRVKFELDKSSIRTNLDFQGDYVYKFPSLYKPVVESTSLKQKISDFFAKLF